MLSIERQIGIEDPRLWMLIHRTINFTVPIVQQVIEDYVKNMSDDTVYWQSQSDGTAKGKFGCRSTKLSTLVMKLYYRFARRIGGRSPGPMSKHNKWHEMDAKYFDY